MHILFNNACLFIYTVIKCKHISQQWYLHMSNEESTKPTGKAKGGVARAKSLTKEQRTEIAKKAAAARWKDKPLKATHMGNFNEQFGIDAECFVLNDESKTVVVTKKGLAQLLNIGDTGKTVDELLNAQYMSDFSDRELRDKFENPLVFQYSGKSKNINNAHGFDITVIVDIGKALIEAKEAGALPSSRLRSAEAAQRLINASAKSGIKGVAYALAGYQPEVQEVIDAFKLYVREEARSWEKEFPDELYYEWYRLYELKKPEKGGHPGNFRWFTERHIYETLAKSEGKILDLAKENREENGKRGDKIHMFLSDVGVKALRRHIGKIIGMASMCETKEQYESALERVFK